MNKKLKKWWENFKEAVLEICVWYNASSDIEDGRDPRDSLQHSRTLKDVSGSEKTKN